ncbi:hypothetical protein [Streptomyces spinosus]|uniref:hypothetical protein n=1 Tax=Streptomyces spinosus TaxID=2872623 RepID=UPI001CEC983A|nr:hypothetical protein [Streptomyces spinosus]
MRVRRILTACIATAALTGLGFTGAATAIAATTPGAHSYVTPSECKQGGGMADLTDNVCKGGKHDGEKVD